MTGDRENTANLGKKRMEKEMVRLQMKLFGKVKTKDLKKLIPILEEYGADPLIIKRMKKIVFTNEVFQKIEKRKSI